MGQLDANGVWEYDLDDPPYSPEALNLGMASVSNVLASGVHIQRVANTSERDSYLSDFVASVGGAPTAANPCVVWRGNNSANRYIEFTVNGVNWVPLSPPLQDTGWVTSGFTLGAGASSIGVQRIRRVGDVVSLVVNTIVVSTPINIPVSGDAPNTVMAKVPSGFEPTQEQALAAYGIGPVTSWIISPNGNLTLTAIAPPSTWTGTTAWTGTISVGGTYLLG